MGAFVLEGRMSTMIYGNRYAVSMGMLDEGSVDLDWLKGRNVAHDTSG